jgi:hypothetical protein
MPEPGKLRAERTANVTGTDDGDGLQLSARRRKSLAERHQ